jgi:hypothetical protein
MGRAEKCHLISRIHCQKYPQKYPQYDDNPNNWLAMYRDLHGWFNLTTVIPLFYLKVVSVSESFVIQDRYKVVLAVVAVDQESAGMIFRRLIEGSTIIDDPLIMNTFVYVNNPAIFRKCLEWKEKRTTLLWAEYYSMDSAVP